MAEKSGEPSAETEKGKPFQLRPSALASSFGSTSTKSFILRPSSLGAIADQIEKKSSADDRKRPADSSSTETASAADDHKTKKVKENTSDGEELNLTEPLQHPTGIGTFGFGALSDASAPVVPSNGASVNSSSNGSTSENYFLQTPSSRSSGFVFGQHGTASSAGFNSLVDEGTHSDGQSSRDASQANGSDHVSSTTADSATAAGGSVESLLKVAGEHMKKNDNRTRLHEVEVTDGEEGERNVLQMQCKVHIFNSDRKSWVERGRGSLKVNDICQSETQGVFQSRLVFRMQGSFSVVVNTKLWPEMRCDKVNEKSLRLTGMNADSNDIIVFLVTASKKDIVQLYTAIDRRLLALKRNQDNESQNSTSRSTVDTADSRLADDEDSSSPGQPDTSLSEDNSRDVDAATNDDNNDRTEQPTNNSSPLPMIESTTGNDKAE